jgi:hypothetical protein
VVLNAPGEFTTVVASIVALCALSSSGRAQYGGYGDPYRNVIVTAPSPYWGYSYNPYAGYLQGAAAVTQANGDYLIKTQEAALLREKVRQTRLETRRLQLEHWEWEREFRFNANKRERERIHQLEMERARELPPLTEILAAIPLNKLYDELRKLPELPDAASMKVDPEWLAHIHTTVDGRGNMGLLKSDHIFWPQLLLRSEFTEVRERIGRNLTQAKQLAQMGQEVSQVDPGLLRDLNQMVVDLRIRLDNELRSGSYDTAWNMRHYTEAKRFLKHVDDAIYVLEQPDAAMHLNPLRGATVAELVTNMKKQGIRFAPATVGSERFYIAMHRALADEVTRLQGEISASKKE